MKFDKSKTFPYPVLRPYSDDYCDCEFQATADFDVIQDKVVIKCTYETSSTELKQQIALGFAKYVSVLSCRETYFRIVLKTEKENVEQEINTEQLRGEVTVESYIVAIKEIRDFSSPDINAEFGMKRFHFNPGEILAQDETQSVYIERDLFKPISSVFELVKKTNLSGGEWRVSLEQDNVQIEVSPEMKESIDSSRNNTASKVVLLNSIYFAAVVQAVQRLKDGNDFGDLKWSRVMQHQIHNQHLDLITTDAYIVSQKLMKHPLGILTKHVFSKE
jgi:hypothetical protein